MTMTTRTKEFKYKGEVDVEVDYTYDALITEVRVYNHFLDTFLIFSGADFNRLNSRRYDLLQRKVNDALAGISEKEFFRKDEGFYEN
jgi:hypothetical protein